MVERKKFLLRLDPKLWDELNRWANHELRSVNGQIEYLLREAVQRRTKKELPFSSPEKEDDHNPSDGD